MTTAAVLEAAHEGSDVVEYELAAITVSEKGQVTLPIAVRRRLGIEPGSRLEVGVRGNKIVLRRIRTVAELAGILKDRAKPGTTWEQERAAAEKSIAEEAVSVD
jgi:antitoxin PrlF